MKLTRREKRCINALKKLEEIWPASLWLFGSGEALCIVRCNSEGEKATLPEQVINFGRPYDPDYIIDDIDIPYDGGDW